jgi:PKD domain
MGKRILVFASGMLSIVLVLASSPTAGYACTIDNKPSVYANGLLAIVAPAPTQATWPTWAHFIFPRAFHSKRTVTLSENVTLVRTALNTLRPVPENRPWRWDFGDGKTAYGARVSHSFPRAKRYRVSVQAYFKGYGWQAFDTVTINVVK